jgi:hypothetical protein
MAFTWGGTIFDGQAPSLTPAYLVGDIAPGYTLRRTLLWVQSILEYTSPDSLAGTAMMYGLVVGPSNTAPPETPYTNWADPNSGHWLWTWAARYKEAYALPGSSPQQYIGYSDLDTLNFDIQVQRKNTNATAHEYLWFVGEVHPGVSGPQVTTSTYMRNLYEHP